MTIFKKRKINIFLFISFLILWISAFYANSVHDCHKLLSASHAFNFGKSNFYLFALSPIRSVDKILQSGILGVICFAVLNFIPMRLFSHKNQDVLAYSFIRLALFMSFTVQITPYVAEPIGRTDRYNDFVSNYSRQCVNADPKVLSALDGIK